MKLCRYGAVGQERPGIFDTEGQLRDLSGHCRDIEPGTLSPKGLERLRAIDPASLPKVDGQPRFGVPWTGMPKYVCIGLNYSDHAAETGAAIPKEPIIFLKAISAIGGPNDDIVQPLNSSKLDWEVELGIVIGQRAQNVSEADAGEYIAGYCVLNDVSERAFQSQSTQWDKGKGCDTFGPVGPFLVTADEIEDPQALELWADVNGTRMQNGNTRDMIFKINTLISYVSRYMTLHPGDVIATGTPAGVGMGRKPKPVWLLPGDRISVGIQNLGQQEQRVVPHPQT